jgi:hypothetical protein
MQDKGIKEKVNRSIIKQSYRLSLDETKNILKIGNARGRLQHGGCVRSEDIAPSIDSLQVISLP